VSNAVSYDIATHLAANAFGTVGTDLFGMAWGKGVDAQTLVMDSAGFESDQKLEYEKPGFQILVRGERNESAKTVYDSARAIYIFLINVADLVTINAVDYLGFEPQSNIAPLGYDENERFIYSMNFYTYRNPE